MADGATGVRSVTPASGAKNLDVVNGLRRKKSGDKPGVSKEAVVEVLRIKSSLVNELIP
jgi:hypothetical protein